MAAFRFPLYGAAVLLAAYLAWPGAASALDARTLTGWWLSIDDTFPKLWNAGVTPTEEVLVINADGRFEDRVMNFSPGTAQVCAQKRVCADMVLLAYGRLRFAGDSVSIGERGAPPNRLDTPKTDPLIRRVAMSTTTTWTISVDNGLMTLRAGNVTRSFAKIEPRRLQRLRSGMRAAGLPPEKHWRCFLANAMAPQPAFASLRGEATGTVQQASSGGLFNLGGARASAETPAPGPAEWLERYLRAASYLMTLDARSKFPIIEDPASRPFIGHEPEQLLVEEFTGVTPPATLADMQRLKAQIASIEGRVRDKLKELSGGGPAPAGGRAALSDAEIAAFATAASEDPEAKRMFCRE
jgi:hypothetical protein